MPDTLDFMLWSVGEVHYPDYLSRELMQEFIDERNMP